MRTAAVAILLALTACESREAREAKEAVRVGSAIAAAETTARAAASLPQTGKWTEANLLDRLVRTGVAPREAATKTAGPEWMPREAIQLEAGGSNVRVWIFADSVARRAATDSLDQSTGTPKGRAIPYPMPFVWVMQNNLAAVITGGSERNQERIMLALEAGLRAAP